jgi:hypothetical protein
MHDLHSAKNAIFGDAEFISKARGEARHAHSTLRHRHPQSRGRFTERPLGALEHWLITPPFISAEITRRYVNRSAILAEIPICQVQLDDGASGFSVSR